VKTVKQRKGPLRCSNPATTIAIAWNDALQVEQRAKDLG